VVKLATERATGKEYAVRIMGLPEPGRPLNDYESTQARDMIHASCSLAQLPGVQIALSRTCRASVVQWSRSQSR